MGKKVISIVLGLIMLLSVITGCSSDTAPSVSTESTASESSAGNAGGALKPAELTMWTFLDLTSKNARAIVLGNLIKNFEAANPGIKIKVETQEWSTMSAKIIAGHAAGNSPDIFMINMANLGEAIAAGCMEPLENLFLNNWTEEQLADIDSELFKAGYDGKYHYEIPLFSGTFGIMYRTDLFEKFGIKVEDIKTWENLAEAAKKLTYVNEDKLQVYGYGVGYSTDVTDPHGVLPTALFSQEGSIFTKDGKPNNWAGEAGKAALQFQIDLIDKYKVMPSSSVALTSEEVYNMFEAGQFAMISGGSIRMPTVKSLTSFDPNYVGFMAYPEWNKGQGSSIANAYAWNTAVWSGSKNKEAAGKFLEYLVSPEADKMWVKEANQIPVLSSTFNSEADFINTPANNWMTKTKDIYSNSALVFSGAYGITGFALDLQNAMIYAYSDGMSVEDALKKAEKDFTDRNVDR
ncbi:carbohydrate ABC transporter substrate-binding protein (CUT1 family) [Ruminiclostridium sufflavum DSM 19573]|uniref:Carbohydrate ABC transporter substrate-binding protein (CUT1 family) n=1 Tax=Ruminiclostridium sufflavum DSM 19573 TaxID=1121337 RepID=A0A318XWF2_9FIRM|nr:sugar ABC transporter substrate-binding protein [Ruminiclostridium sufflavum]PYG87127.1 carbohydrate ABC transporter substrate-binding protein (CUT1 family) [Ruminiclostridium sufflavum DSM 19573]